MEGLSLKSSAIFLVATVLLSGCVDIPFLNMKKEAPDSISQGAVAAPGVAVAAKGSESSATLLAFVATPKEYDTGFIRDPVSSTLVRATVTPVYHAASGHSCRHYHVAYPRETGGPSSGLACKDTSGKWSLVRLVINPDKLEKSRSSTWPTSGQRE